MFTQDIQHGAAFLLIIHLIKNAAQQLWNYNYVHVYLRLKGEESVLQYLVKDSMWQRVRATFKLQWEQACSPIYVLTHLQQQAQFTWKWYQRHVLQLLPWVQMAQ